MLRLILIINSLAIGGAERVLIRLANYWATCGHQVYFVTFFEEEKFFYQLKLRNNLNLMNLGESKPLKTENFIQQFFRLIKRIFLLIKLFKQLKPDSIISFFAEVNVAVLLTNLYFKIPVLVSERTDPRKYDMPMFYKKLRFLTYNKAAAVVVQTKYIATYFPEKLQNKIVIIPNFVMQPKNKKKLFDINVEPSLHYQIKNIISIGRLVPEKDHKTLIYAFARIINYYPDLTLTIYGEGALRVFLQDLIVNLGLCDKVFLPGIITNVEKFLIKGDLFIFPSICEGFSNALCEAMSCALPVIASDCPGNIDIIEDGVNGLLFKCGDIKGLTLLIEKLLNDPKYCNQLAHNAQKVVNKFSRFKILNLWDDIVAQVVQ